MTQFEYVDLGLPSGLKWAKCNLGAENETDYGDYFMWGSVTPNTPEECTWTNAPFNGGLSYYNSTYFSEVKDTVWPNGVLTKEYDAASQIMGGDWRMPTRDEFQELLDNTDNEWIEDFNGSGVNGRKFTSKINGNSIFIPASGVRSGSAFCYQGIFSQVWSSSLVTESPSFAWNLYFNLGGISAHSTSGRYFRFAVRGVMS